MRGPGRTRDTGTSPALSCNASVKPSPHSRQVQEGRARLTAELLADCQVRRRQRGLVRGRRCRHAACWLQQSAAAPGAQTELSVGPAQGVLPASSSIVD